MTNPEIITITLHPVIADCIGCGAPMGQGYMSGLVTQILSVQRGDETFHVGLCGRCTLRRISAKEMHRRIGQKHFQRYVISEANLAKVQSRQRPLNQ